jgi:hypothetical protein
LVYEIQYRRSGKYWMFAGIFEMVRRGEDPGRSRRRLNKLVERAMRLNPELCSPLSLKLLNLLEEHWKNGSGEATVRRKQL